MFLSEQQIRKFWETNYPGMKVPRRSSVLLGLAGLAAYFGFGVYCYVSWRYGF